MFDVGCKLMWFVASRKAMCLDSGRQAGFTDNPHCTMVAEGLQRIDHSLGHGAGVKFTAVLWVSTWVGGWWGGSVPMLAGGHYEQINKT